VKAVTTAAVFSAFVLALATATVAEAETTTTKPSVYVTVHVTLTNTKVVVRPKAEPRGAIARFVVHNSGTKPIAFNVGKQTRGLGVLFGFRRVFKPGEHRVVLVYLDRRGLLPYFAGTSYDRASKAERGEFLIGETCRLCAPVGAPPLP
jgi:hypothetical protein